MKKRICTTLLAIIMAFAMSATAFGETIEPEGQADALGIALMDAGISESEAIVTEYELDRSGVFEIEFIRAADNAEFSYEISAADGVIIEKSVEFAYKKIKSKKKIGKKNARKIVAQASGKSYSVVKKGTCKYKYKKKQGKYEIKFRSGGYKYEYELLAPNGTIIEYEYERIGTR